MSDRGNRPARDVATPPIIVFASRCSAGLSIRAFTGTTPASGTSPFAANEMQAFPFTLTVPTPVAKGFWLNGSSAGGNSSVGIYDADFKLIAETASTGGSGNSVPQAATLTAKLRPGLYYCAMSHSATTTNQVFRYTSTWTGSWAMMGCWKQGSITVGALPSTATPAATTAGSFPVFGLITRTVFDV